MPAPLLPSLLLACAGSTGGDTGTGGHPVDTVPAPVLWDLAAEGSSWQRFHHEEDFYLNVVRDHDGVVVATDHQFLSGDTVSLFFPALLQDGVAYTLDYFADHNLDGVCSASPSPTDHVWHQSIGVASGPMTVLVHHEGETIDHTGCESF